MVHTKVNYYRDRYTVICKQSYHVRIERDADNIGIETKRFLLALQILRSKRI